MWQAHDSLRSGHGGQAVTKARLGGFWWPSIVNDIVNYVKSCAACQTRKAERALPIGGRAHFEACRPNEIVCVDTCGPLPETITGFRYVIIAVDTFTKFVEARALREVKAEECALFLNEYFGRYGPPRTVVTDNGPQFLNDLVKETLRVYGIGHRWSTPDHSQGNAVAERAIQTFQEKLSLNRLGQAETDCWDALVPVTALAVNTSVSQATGLTPYELRFGLEAEIYDNLVSRQSSPQHLHTRLLKASLDRLYSRAIERQEVARSNTQSNFDRVYRERKFNVGDLVLMRDPNRRKGKLDQRFLGPFKVIEEKAKDVYLLEKVGTKVRVTRHSGSLKPFVQRQETSAASPQQEPAHPPRGARSPVSSRQATSPQQQERVQPTRAAKNRNASRAGPSGVAVVFIAVVTCLMSSSPSFTAFQREPNTMWLWKDRTVLQKYVVYDMAAIIRSPCLSLLVQTDKFSHTEIKAHYETGAKSEAVSLHTAMQEKCDKFDREIFWAAAMNMVNSCVMPDAEDNGEGRRRSIISSFFGGVTGGFAGCVVMDLVGAVWDYINPNSDYNRINRLEGQYDAIEAKHAHVLGWNSSFIKLRSAFIAERALPEGSWWAWLLPEPHTPATSSRSATSGASYGTVLQCRVQVNSEML